jgi:hypothetical protein
VTWSTEEIVDAAITTLSASLPAALDARYAALAAADAAAGRSIDYSAPRPGLAETGGDYHAGAVSTILRYPCVEVALPDLNMASFDLSLVEADVTENLVIVAWESSAEMSTLYRKLTRLAAAIYDVLLDPATLTGANVQTVRAAWRWNPEASDRDEIESGALLVLGLSSTRARP